MASLYGNMRIEDFIARLSSRAPTPGGGSVAALAGAMAASLVSMVVSLTIGKKKYEQHEHQLKTVLEKSRLLTIRLLQAADEDTRVFEAVMNAYRLSKDDDKRKEKLEAALKEATVVPFETAETCYQILELAKDLVSMANINVISDVEVATYLAEAALQSALCNVDINCNYIGDEKYVEEFKMKKVDLAQQATSIKNETITHILAMFIIKE